MLKRFVSDNVHLRGANGRSKSAKIAKGSISQEQAAWSPEEREHHREERRYWFWTLVLTLGAVIGAISTVVLSKRSLDESQKSLAEARRATGEAHRQAVAAEGMIPRSWLYIQLPSAEEISKAQINCHSIEILFSPFTCLVRNDKPDKIRSYRLDFGFAVHNFGQIPARINSLEALMYIVPPEFASDSPIDHNGNILNGVLVYKAVNLDSFIGKIIPRDGSISTQDMISKPQFYVLSLPTIGESFGFHPKWIRITIGYNDPFGDDREVGYMVKAKIGEIVTVNDRRFTYEK